jgi:hypothetical protein
MGKAMRLTEAKIRSLTSQGREYKEYFHEPTPAAGIRVYRGGRKVFFLYYRSPVLKARSKAGEALLRRVWFGCHESGKPAWNKDPEQAKRKARLSCISLKEFEAEYRKFVGKLAEGIDPQEKAGLANQAEPQTAQKLDAPTWLRDLFPEGYGEGTLSHILAKYFEAAKTGTLHQKRLKPRTLNGYKTAAKIYILKRLGNWPAIPITQDQVSDLFTEIARTAPQMVRNVKKVLSGAYEHARATNLRGMRSYPNPTRGMKIAIPKGKRERWLKDDELEILLPGLERLSDGKARDVYMLILASGCRPGEAAGVMAEEISMVNDEGIWKIRYKVDRDHLVPLVGPIAEILRRRCRRRRLEGRPARRRRLPVDRGGAAARRARPALLRDPQRGAQGAGELRLCQLGRALRPRRRQRLHGRLTRRRRRPRLGRGLSVVYAIHDPAADPGRGVVHRGSQAIHQAQPVAAGHPLRPRDPAHGRNGGRDDNFG